jgi:hypothetical protein
MTPLSLLPRCLGIAGLLSLVVAVPLSAQTVGRGAVPAEVTAATDFLLLVYPDLATRPVTVTFNPSGRTVAVSVADAPGPGEAPSAGREPLLTAGFEFAESGELQSFAATGVLLERTRNETLARTLAEHPAWTDTDAEAALLALGGRPSTAVPPMSQIEPAKLAPFVGASPAPSKTSQLRWRPSTDVADQPFAATPGWTAEVAATTRDGKRATYRLVFEPFGGRLVLVTRE